MKREELKTPKGTKIKLENFAVWPLANSWKIKIDGKTYIVSDESIYRAGGWKRIGKTNYEISEGGKLKITSGRETKTLTGRDGSRQ